MANLDLHYVDELIDLRRQQHGGGRGAPLLVNGYRVGASLNRSCIVLLSAQLQTFVEEVFFDAAVRLLPHMQSERAQSEFRKSFGRWGNPSDGNITGLFARLGTDDVLRGLSWRKCSNATVRNNLQILNEVRNGIAHGRSELRAFNRVFVLNLAAVQGYRDFVAQFAPRFERHVVGRLPALVPAAQPNE